MATLVCFHAHPDDECIATGGVMARAADAGHRVVLVTATRGEHGEVQPGVLADGEELWQRREVEVEAASRILGVQRHEFLGYVDSGMMGTPENDAAEAFWQADVDAAAQRLAAILAEESADVLTTYDANGNYGHPDHIQVHRVGARAASLAGVPRLFEATMDRDHLKELMRQRPDLAPEEISEEDLDMGSPGSVITTRVDVAPWLGRKRDAMRAHASQIAADSFFLAMPEEAFAMAFGTECFIQRGPSAVVADDLLAGL